MHDYDEKNRKRSEELPESSTSSFINRWKNFELQRHSRTSSGYGSVNADNCEEDNCDPARTDSNKETSKKQKPGRQISNWSRSNDINTRYLAAVSSGSVKKVQEIFELHKNDRLFNKNHRNRRDENALRIAIDNKNADMFEVLLERGVEILDNFFHAVNNNFVEGVEMLLARDAVGDVICILTNKESFCDGTTPMTLAAKKNYYETLELLYQNGYRLETPGNHVTEEDGRAVIECTAQKMKIAEAKASPAYISLMSQEEGKDSYHFCIELIKEFKKSAALDHEVLDFYKQLQCQVEEYMCTLLDQVRSSDELRELFRFDDETTTADDERKRNCSETNDCEAYTRKMELLEEACKNDLVKFVTHQTSQLSLTALRTPYFSCMKKESRTRKYFVEGSLGLLYPVWSLMYILFPKTRLGGAILHPSISLASHLVSDFTFIGLLIINAFQRSPQNDYLGAPPTAVEWLIFLWVMGKLFKEIVEFYHKGWKNYLCDWWNYNDWAQITLFLAVIICRILDYSKHQGNSERITRGAWAPFEPRTIATGCLAMAYIFVFLQILNLMRTNRTFGPLQISLAKMLVNVVQFLCIFSLIIFAFALSLTELYSYYGTPEGSRKLCKFLGNDTSVKCNYIQFKDMKSSLHGLFWYLFGNIEVDTLSLYGKQPFLEVIGFILTGTYHVAAIIILINMLIAMMAKSFEATSENKEAEWKFYRTVVWIQFIRRETTIPPPMNLIPNPWQIAKFVKTCYLKLKKKRCPMKESEILDRFSCKKVNSVENVAFKPNALYPTSVTNVNEINQTSQHSNSNPIPTFIPSDHENHKKYEDVQDEVDFVPMHKITGSKKETERSNKKEEDIFWKNNSKEATRTPEEVLTKAGRVVSDSIAAVIENQPTNQNNQEKQPTQQSPKKSILKATELNSQNSKLQSLNLERHGSITLESKISDCNRKDKETDQTNVCQKRNTNFQTVTSKLVQRYIRSELLKDSTY